MLFHFQVESQPPRNQIQNSSRNKDAEKRMYLKTFLMHNNKFYVVVGEMAPLFHFILLARHIHLDISMGGKL
jgi:hypothetical protein